ncbi:TPA: helix-turn-helix transcriptional regulator [Vibrio parahaemolyticus]
MSENQVRQFRIKKKINKKELANSVGVSTAKITAIENGAEAEPEEYARIALKLAVTIDELYPALEHKWPELEKKKRFIEIQQEIEAEIEEKQLLEKESLEDEIKKRRKEKEKLKQHIRKIEKDREVILKEHEELTDQATKNRILRELNFAPEYQEAGITILQGFIRLLKRKYKEKDVSVSIKQHGMKVTMIIKTPDGKTDEVEEFLDQYSEVISGTAMIETLTTDPVAVLELKNQLNLAEIQVQQQRDINLILKTNHDSRIKSLEKENAWFKEQLSLAVASSKHFTSEILNQLNKNDNDIASLAQKLVDIVEKSESNSKEIAAVNTKTEEASRTIDELNKMVLKDGIGKGASEAIKNLIKWAASRLTGI